ncbi:MAG: hypothetical protein HRF50_02430 [Phycisphaerae bacterium]|jgi:hypothetical protein
MAFRLDAYARLLSRLRENGYSLRPVRAYFEAPTLPAVHLKHDVDRLPARAVAMARAEHALGAAGTYYFRCSAAGTFPAAAIREVASLGHEIGFHYECLVRERGDGRAAARRFERELAALREIAPVVTVAAHGSPLSRTSNMGQSRGLDLARLGLLGEPGVHFDFERCVYVTDTGGVFGSAHNVRDRVQGENWPTPTPPDKLALALTPGRYPLVLLNTHPERWPRGQLGMLQATISDALANAAKRWVHGRRTRDAH